MPPAPKDLARRVQTCLIEDCRLDPRLPLAAGFSGGADSLCLLGLLAELGWRVSALHFDHQLRAGSSADAVRAAELAKVLGTPFTLGEGDVAAYARAEKLSIEDAARRLRYRFLFTAARRLGAQAVCVAHTTDDQAETLLLHLLRGAGLAGLTGMAPRSLPTEWDADLPLARPLLGLTRAETESWCRARGLAPVEDPSNADPAYTRNRIRRDLLPALESYNPRIRATLARTAEALAGDQAIAAAQVESTRRALRRGAGEGWEALDLAGLRALEEGLLRGVLRQVLSGLLSGDGELGFEAVRQAAGFARRPSRGGSSELADGLELWVEDGRLVLARESARPAVESWPQLGPAGECALPVPGRVALAAGRWIVSRVEAAPRNFAGGDSEAWLDRQSLAGGLVVRAARPGERLRPLGMGGRSQKLSDFWINNGVPRRARAAYPLVCCGEEVVWTPGLRLAEPFRVTSATREVIYLRLEKDPA